MTLQLLFWILMLFWAIFGFWSVYTPGPHPLKAWGGNALLFFLFLIIGWQVFGQPVK
jgi:uncharacterized membrane protein